jgi:hypothetical protein
VRHRLRSRSFVAPFIALVVALAFLACAGSIRDNVRKGALLAGETVLTIDQEESALYATGAYGVEKHKEIGGTILTAMRAVQVYVRAARAWPENMVMPDTVIEAMLTAVRAITAVEHIIEGVPGNAKLLAALHKIKAQIGGE